MTSLIDIRQTPEFANFMKAIGWETHQFLLQNKKINQSRNTESNIWYFVKKLSPLPFSLIKIHRPPIKISLTAIKKLAQKHHALYIKISPFNDPGLLSRLRSGKNKKKLIITLPAPLIYKFYYPNKLNQDKDPYIPTKTIWVSLNTSEKQLLANMKAKTRYNIKKTKQLKSLKIKTICGNKITDSQILSIYRLWKNNNKAKKLWTPSINEVRQLISSFGKKCFIVSVFKDKEILSFCLILMSPNISFYWHNASNTKGRKLFAPTLCTWQAILESKKRAMLIFDFEGIYDPRFHQSFKNWRGFSRFKLGFI